MGSFRNRVPGLNAGAGADERNFFRLYNHDFHSKELEVPEVFVSRFLGRAPDVFRLESAQGSWRVGTRNEDQSMFFSAGWPAFVHGNNLLTGDFLTFRYEGGSSFDVAVYGLHACRKDADMTRTSGSRASIWASSFKSLAPKQDMVSPVKFPKEELQDFSEEEGSGGHGGASRRRGRRLSSSEDDISYDGSSRGGRRRFGRSVIPSYKRGRKLSSSGEDDSSDDGSRSRSPPVHLSSGRDRLYTGTSRSNKATAQFPPQPRARIRDNDDVVPARLHSKERFRSRLEEEGQGVYDGRTQRRGRASLSSSEDDSRGWARRTSRRRSPPRHPSSGRDGLKTGTMFPPHHRAKNHSARQMRRSASLPRSEDDSSYDGGKDGGRRFQRIRTPSPNLSSGSRHGPKSGVLRPHMAATKFAPQSQARNHGSSGGPSARLHPREELQDSSEEDRSDGSGAQRSASLSSSEDDISDDGSRGGGRRIGRTRSPPPHSRSGRKEPKAGVMRPRVDAAKFAPNSQARYHGSSGGPSARLRPKEELEGSSEEEGRGGYGGVARPRGRASRSDYKYDISDDGSRGGGGGRIPRSRTMPYSHENGRDVRNAGKRNGGVIFLEDD